MHLERILNLYITDRASQFISRISIFPTSVNESEDRAFIKRPSSYDQASVAPQKGSTKDGPKGRKEGQK